MSQNREIKIEAKTVEAAVVMACVKLGVTQENIEYEVVKQPKSGILGLFGSKAEIRAWARSGRQGAHKGPRNDRPQNRDQNRNDGQNRGRRDQSEALKAGERDSRGGKNRGRPQERGGRNQNQSRDDRKPREFTQREPREERAPAEPLTAEMLSQLEIEIRTFCKELCEKIVGESVTVTSNMTAERLQLEVDSAAIAQMIQDQGKFIESLEHVLRKKPRHLKQDLPFRIFIDAQGSRKNREEDISRVAKEKADHVAETGQRVVLDYKSASDRKIVHMTLENDDRVYTKSIGNGSGRKLMILPSRGRKQPTNSQVEEGEDNVHA